MYCGNTIQQTTKETTLYLKGKTKSHLLHVKDIKRYEFRFLKQPYAYFL